MPYERSIPYFETKKLLIGSKSLREKPIRKHQKYGVLSLTPLKYVFSES